MGYNIELVLILLEYSISRLMYTLVSEWNIISDNPIIL